VPGETLEVTVALFDAGDVFWDTTALLDAFEWSCVGCNPTAGECGITPAG
jgi:hypothetical protein